MQQYGFFTQQWAEQAKAFINQGHTAEYKATKLQTYWDWIDRVSANYSGTLALGVTHLPDGPDLETAFIHLTFANGQVTGARAVSAQEAFTAEFVLQGKYKEWHTLMNGFEIGKGIMYRKLRLEKGDVLEFFNRIFFFVEALACLPNVPTRFPETAA
jgi:hypothetical protein